MTNELKDLILGFPVVSLSEGLIATCAQQGFSVPFVNTSEVYMFLVKFLTYLKSSVRNQTICCCDSDYPLCKKKALSASGTATWATHKSLGQCL